MLMKAIPDMKILAVHLFTAHCQRIHQMVPMSTVQEMGILRG